MNMRPRSPTPMLRALLALVLLTLAGSVLADPPGRVVRMSYISGNASFQPGGDDRWSEALINRPLVAGDRLYTDRDSRVELEVGAAVLRADDRTSLAFLDVTDDIVQVELTQGTLNLKVKRLFDGQTYEIDTPTLAFVVDRPGSYRIDIAPEGDSTMLTVFDGSGSVYGQNSASYRVESGQAYRFYDSSLRDYEAMDLPRNDDFDRWCFERDGRYERSVARQYVSEEVIGYADLDGYGSWSTDASYGAVWYPTSVSVGWAPYRYGRWSWIDPWGWSWVDDAPWGFAPSHYGRWVYVGSRWGWCPGPRHVRPIYAPALVGFIGGRNWSLSISSGGGPVGWFPLGPRDVYVPWYRSSRNYFTNVNVTNIRNTTVINNTYITNVYNNYAAGRVGNLDYAYRRDVNAVTAVPDNVFNSSGRVGNARLNLDRNSLARAEIVNRVPVLPVQASLAPNDGSRAAPQRAASFDRQVIARNTPPPAPAPFAQRKAAIDRNGGQPLQTQELRQLATRSAPVSTERVKVVGTAGQRAPQALPPRGESPTRIDRASAGNAPARGIERPDAVKAPERAPSTLGRETATPRPAPRTEISERALPSSGYAPRRERAVVPGQAPKAGQAPSPSSRVIESRGGQNVPDRPARVMQSREPTPQRSVQAPNRTAPSRVVEPAAREAAPARSYRAPAVEPRKYEAPANRPEPRAAPQRMERSQPQAAPQRIEPSRPQAAPQRMERSQPQAAPQRMERSQPQAAPQRMERNQPQAAPRSVQQSPPREQGQKGERVERKRDKDDR
ncbi:DUF6600 domain-containing protein [Dokdonella koreensis]|uniref:Prolin-rich exported protein n=1 Tax=Dokdonella koreensis DS-123 TaxID=1300342 RepID=A0A167GP84_9GAMM|nr:DUF6600 domain-containing protein [Dokdonella koreensis]ANB16956.1 Putative prolin-rich exported protein [Dokdonella koreensis DS-123]